MDSYQLRRDNHKVTIDFSEFDSLEQLLKEPFIEKNWNLLKEMYSSGHIIFLLTSRYNPNEIFEWLCHNQMFIKKDKILTRLDHPQYKNTISKQFKKDMVFQILEKYGTSVVWVEDDISAIEGVVKDIRYGIYQNKLQIILYQQKNHGTFGTMVFVLIFSEIITGGNYLSFFIEDII